MKLYLIKIKHMELNHNSLLSTLRTEGYVPIIYAFRRKKEARDYIDKYLFTDIKYEILTVNVEP